MGLGDKAAALALSERAMAANPIEKDPLTGPWSLVSPQFKPVSSDRRFQNLVQRIGLSR